MVGAAVVASPVYPYKEPIAGVKTIDDGITGMLAYTQEEWFNKLDFLIQHPVERKQLAKQAYDYVKEHWLYEQWVPKWTKVINKYLGE